MAVTRQQLRLAGCGAVAALSLAVLCLHRPSAWGQYVAWSIARIGLPLFVLLSGILAAGLLLLAFSRYRRKPELLAAALAISALLHLLTVASLTFWDVGEVERPRVGEEVRYELAVGLPSLAEDRVARQLQEALLEPLELEEKSVDTGKPATAEVETPVEAPSAPDLETPERDPSALAPLKAKSAGERRLEIEEVTTEKAQAEADVESRRILKMRSAKTVAEAEDEARKDARALEAERVEAAPVEVPAPGSHAPAPELPTPERAERMESREIKLDHAVPLKAEVKPRQAQVELETVKLDVAAAAEAVQQAVEEVAGQKVDGRQELAVAAPKRTAAKVPLPSVDTPVMSTQVDTPAPQAIPQELPGVRKREAPDNPVQAADIMREVEADAVPLVNRVAQVKAPRLDEDERSAAVPMPAETLTTQRAQALAPSAQAPLQTERPIFAAGGTTAPESSLETVQPVANVSRGAAKPRLMESAEGAAPRRVEEREAASVSVQVALLQEQVAPADTASDPSDASLRELAAGRADLAAIPERETVQRPLPGRTAMPRSSLPAAASQTLVNEQARVQYREAPRAAAEADGGTAASGVRRDAGTVDGLAIRQAQLVASAPGIEGTGEVSREAATIAIAPVARAAGRPGAQAPIRTERPIFAAGGTTAPESSLETVQPVADISHGTSKPRLMESAEAGAPRRAEERNAAAVSVQVALLQEQAAPAGTAAEPSDASLRELAAGRADLAAIPERETAQRPLPGRTAMSSASLPAAASQTLVNEQARVQYRDAPRAVAEADGGTAARGVRHDTGTVDGLAIRQTQLAASVPGTESTGVTARVTASVAIAPVVRAAGRPVAVSAAPATGHPAAPLAVARLTDAASTGSMAGGTLPQGIAGRTVPSAPAADASPAAAPGDAGMMSAGLVAGRVQAVERQSGGTPEGGESQGRGPAAVALTVDRAGRGTETGVTLEAGARPELALSGTADRSGGTLADAVPVAGGLAGTTVRGLSEFAAPGRTPMTADSGTVALPMKAWAVERAPAGDGDVATSVPRAAEIGTLAKAEWGGRDETSASAAPLRGWKAPPLPAGRGSGVRLSLDPATVAGSRRVEAGETQGTGTAPETERSRIADDVVGTTAAAQKKAIYELRSPEKRRFIQELGGSPETEEAVEQALVWLAGAQSDDGRWDVAGFKGVETVGGAGDRIDGNVAVTGLSLLAYLGASYTHTAGKHSETVRKGLEWLIEGQSAEGDLRRGGTMYDQAMATAAICESLSLTGDQRLAEAARLAAGFIMKAQSPNAAWRYQPQVESDTSVLGWQILALKSAEISGVAIPQQHFAWSGMWLDQVRQGNGGLYAYMPGRVPTPVMTAEGWFCQLFMGEEVRRQGRQESINYLLENLPEWSRGGRGTVHLYYWYYATLALRLSGAPEFETWNKALKTALLEGRRREGPAAGSWDPECQLGPRGGRIYATAMSALCLEVYYRYLPFYRRMTVE